ncbi:4-oxalomesaconate tautomerase [Alteromonas sp. 1_MG-2023]|uniref:4-oxalomesaconate tautomerase n=1 Tax=Alteromonas sp. 1_MG-2023 TaxID=3062669 RepID=UPI0026E1B5A6|nr:4-oxalomesaconate tautomerase [Alteromonas sp. 1_MG-2023]MDO6476703.1 4-oxalomesaconate tautomerase [Alteromonas sp. 1_MG-2023]
MKAIPCHLMRGGTSKGLYFLASSLPEDTSLRDQVLLAAMGSPDDRQIDGVGGAHPLTSKVAVVSPSTRDDADVDYLFLQVVVDKAVVSDGQNCGNILAGVGPFAIEQGLIDAQEGTTSVRIHMVNTGGLAVAQVEVKDGAPVYEGDARIDGVPGTAAPVLIDFLDVAGASCGALFPTGNAKDVIDGVDVTCIDNGMPVVLLNAADFGLTGDESPAEIEKNTGVKERIESIRLKAGRQMNLGDVSDKTVPKMSLISAPVRGGLLNTRTFIPHRVHDAIGVLGSVSVATACVVDGSIAYGYLKGCSDYSRLEIEHPTGSFTVAMDVEGSGSLSTLKINRSALLRTARLLMRGEVLVADSAFSAPGKQ